MRTNAIRQHFRVTRPIPELGARAGDILTLSDLSFSINREMPYELSYLVRRDSDNLEPVSVPGEAPSRRTLSLVR